ncbi:hypothetical protein [Frankia tisae]|nr:hypothetical protein [Frankia tisae]
MDRADGAPRRVAVPAGGVTDLDITLARRISPLLQAAGVSC